MGLRELELCCSCKWAGPSRCWYNRDQFYVFSFKLIANSKLKQLRLDSWTIRRDFNGQFHSLGILDLSYIWLSQTGVDYILLTCVNLEQLRLFACTLPTFCSICGPLVRLKVLTLDHCDGIIELVLSAPSLITFENFSTAIPSFSGVLCLKNWLSDMCVDNVAYFNGQLARDVPQLESLSLCRSESVVPYLPRRWNTFSNLKHLTLYFSLGVQYELLDVIPPFLKACPLLEKFHLMLTRKSEETRLPPIVLEKNHFTALKEVECDGFDGSDSQMRLVAYLIENSVSLERMVFTTGYRSYKGFGKFTNGCRTEMDEKTRGDILFRLKRVASISNCSQVEFQVNNNFPERK